VSAEATTLYDRIQEVRAHYPDRHSAILPALHLAQREHGGWLPKEALREVADALDVTPAYCLSIASFYDMFSLEPVGRTVIEVCTNISCAINGAQQVLEAFEQGFDVEAGGTSADGAVTLKTIECAGGCGWPTVIAIDHHQRVGVQPADVPGIVEEVRGGEG
jgi:NADH:ubiquinone oxidoreductase subunit E